MADMVATNGFIGVPPAGAKPGFTPPVDDAAKAAAEAAAKAAAEAAGAAKAAPAGAADESGLAAAIAALTAALGAGDGKPAPAVGEGEVAGSAGAADSLNAFDPASLQDPILRSMATVMQSIGKGIDMDRVFSKALEHGDAGLLDVAYLREKGGENAEQLLTIAQGIVSAVNAQGEALQKSVHEAAGGSATWNASTAVFNKAAPSELRTVAKLLLDSGDANKVKAGAKLVVEFAKSKGLVPQHSARVADGSTAAMPAAAGLSKPAFQDELRKLNTQARDYTEQREALFARRAFGRTIGL